MLKYTENAQVLARMKAATTLKGSYKGYWGRGGW